MASSANKRTTMAKLNRESRLRERRLNKQAKKHARKATADHLDSPDRALNEATTEAGQPGAGQAPIEPVVQIAEID
jgi:hypothetical protein